MIVRLQRLGTPLLYAGALLLCLDVAGLFTSLRNDAIYDEPVKTAERYERVPATYREIVTMSGDELLAAAARRQGETDAKYATRLTMAVNQTIAHYWETAGIDRFHLRVPVQENYLLFAASYVLPESFRKYEFYDHQRAIERGVGYCSQQTVILTRILAEQGIDTRIVVYPNHMFALALVDRARDSWWILDPNHGVVIPRSFDDVRRDPATIVPFYLQAGFNAAYVTHNLISVYGDTSYRIVEGAGGYHRLRQYYEPASFALIWVIPLFLVWSGRRIQRARTKCRAVR